MKRKRRKRIDYGAPSKGKLADVETREQMRSKFPTALVDAFVKISEADWENDKLYKQYKKLEVAYLGEKDAEDPIIQGRLIVQLARATMDIVHKESQSMKCDKHKSYKAIRKPKVDCDRCWEIYNAKQKAKEEKEEAKESS